MSNVATVRAIYQAFGRGDVAAILDRLDDAVEWETTVPVSDVPWLQPRRGKANVVGFFEALAPLAITRFEPHTIFDGGDKVFVLITFDATAQGERYSFPNNGHLWQFNAAGKVVKYDHVTDTAQMIRMAKGAPEGDMDHSTAIRRLYDLVNAGDIDGFGHQLAADFAERDDLPGFPPTREGVIQYFQMLLAAFPDLRMVPQDVIAGGDKAVARVRMTGTHKGPFMGMPATGKRVEVTLVDIIRFGDDGRAREHWGVVDQLAMMQQLGAIPAGGQP